MLFDGRRALTRRLMLALAVATALVTAADTPRMRLVTSYVAVATQILQPGNGCGVAASSLPNGQLPDPRLLCTQDLGNGWSVTDLPDSLDVCSWSTRKAMPALATRDFELAEDVTDEPSENAAQKVFRADVSRIKRCAHDAPYDFHVALLTTDAAPGADAGIEYRTTWAEGGSGDFEAIELIGTTLLMVYIEPYAGRPLADSTAQSLIDAAVVRVRSPKVYPGEPTIVMAPEPIPG